MRILENITWEEDIPSDLPHIKDWMEENEPAFMTDDFSESYRGKIGTEISFTNNWGYVTVFVVTPDYWRWSISVFSPDGHHFDEASSFEHAESIIRRETGEKVAL
jgi:hypothetical protein